MDLIYPIFVLMSWLRLAASLAAEEDKSFTGDASTSGAGTLHEDEDGDEDDEIILVNFLTSSFSIYNWWDLAYTI